jgi:hypothetical protein
VEPVKHKERNKGAGKAGKFFLDRIESGRIRTPEKWQKYQRKHIKKGKKGRRPYPWRKKKKKTFK